MDVLRIYVVIAAWSRALHIQQRYVANKEMLEAYLYLMGSPIDVATLTYDTTV